MTLQACRLLRIWDHTSASLKVSCLPTNQKSFRSHKIVKWNLLQYILWTTGRLLGENSECHLFIILNLFLLKTQKWHSSVILMKTGLPHLNCLADKNFLDLYVKIKEKIKTWKWLNKILNWSSATKKYKIEYRGA